MSWEILDFTVTDSAIFLGYLLAAPLIAGAVRRWSARRSNAPRVVDIPLQSPDSPPKQPSVDEHAVWVSSDKIPKQPSAEEHAAWLSAYENRAKRLQVPVKPTKPRGWIYAYSFEACIRDECRFPIKVGQTRQSVEKRVHEQCRGTAGFQKPKILRKWRSADPRRDESAIHQELRKMGCHNTDGSGREWFHATLAEVELAVAKIISPQQ